MDANFQYGDMISKVRDGFRYVAVIGHANDFAVYHHYETYSIEYVSKSGDKIGANTGRELFRELDHLMYRS